VSDAAEVNDAAEVKSSNVDPTVARKGQRHAAEMQMYLQNTRRDLAIDAKHWGYQVQRREWVQRGYKKQKLAILDQLHILAQMLVIQPEHDQRGFLVGFIVRQKEMFRNRFEHLLGNFHGKTAKVVANSFRRAGFLPHRVGARIKQNSLWESAFHGQLPFKLDRDRPVARNWKKEFQNRVAWGLEDNHGDGFYSGEGWNAFHKPSAHSLEAAGVQSTEERSNPTVEEKPTCEEFQDWVACDPCDIDASCGGDEIGLFSSVAMEDKHGDGLDSDSEDEGWNACEKSVAINLETADVQSTEERSNPTVEEKPTCEEFQNTAAIDLCDIDASGGGGDENRLFSDGFDSDSEQSMLECWDEGEGWNVCEKSEARNLETADVQSTEERSNPTGEEKSTCEEIQNSVACDQCDIDASGGGGDENRLFSSAAMEDKHDDGFDSDRSVFECWDEDEGWNGNACEKPVARNVEAADVQSTLAEGNVQVEGKDCGEELQNMIVLDCAFAFDPCDIDSSGGGDEIGEGSYADLSSSSSALSPAPLPMTNWCEDMSPYASPCEDIFGSSTEEADCIVVD